MPRLIVIHGVDEGRQFDLTEPVIGIGRDTGNTIRLFDTEVSRRHAELRRSEDGDSYRLVDRGSANGIFINANPVKDAALRTGDQVQLGKTVMVFTAGSGGATATRSWLTDSVREFDRAGRNISTSIRKSIDEAEGSRLFTQADVVPSEWLKTRLANLGIMYEASQAVSHILDLDRLLDRILELILQAVDADRAGVLLRDIKSGTLTLAAARYRGGANPVEPFRVSQTIIDHVLKERAGVLVSDAPQDARFRGGQSIVRLGICEVICVPMKGRHESIGVMYLDTRRNATKAAATGADCFTEDHLALAVAVAHQAALAVEETRYHQALVHSERLAAVGEAVAALSHHIKNILQGLRTGSEVLKLAMAGGDDEMAAAGWKLVEKNQSRIYNLVMDMLSYSKDRQPEAQPAELNQLVHEVIELARPGAVDRGVTVRTELARFLPPVSADGEGIHRVILNLVTNAIDAVDGRPEPTVTVTTEEEPDSAWVRAVVADNGPGIDPATMAEIFKPFVSTKGSRGTGLGLAVSRKIAREHGGDILVESEPGGGSRFIVRLPVKPVSELDSMLFPAPDLR